MITKPEDINSIESEAGVIATLIHHPEWSFYSEHLLPNHFTDKKNKCVYTAICDLARKGINTIDTYNIFEDLTSSEATRRFSEDITIDEVNELMEMSSVLCRDTVEEYKLLVANVLDAAFRRDMYSSLKEIESLCANNPSEDVQQKIYDRVFDRE